MQQFTNAPISFQAVVLDSVTSIELSAPGAPSQILRDLSEYATLPFLAAFDVPEPPAANTALLAPSPAKRPAIATQPQKRITYIALSKKCMPLLVDLFVQFKDQEELYVSETLEAVLSAYSIPIKLKYDCPPASKFGKDLPLWKTATTSFLRVVKEIAPQIKNLGDGKRLLSGI